MPRCTSRARALALAPALALVLAAAPAAAQDAPAAAPKKKYVCPPCPVDCHDAVFDAPGACPTCGMTLIEKDAVRNVAIVIWPGVEILDFAGPTEVFAATRVDGAPAFNVYTVAATREPIVSQGVVTVTPAFTIDDCPKPDIFVLPGGGTGSPLGNPAMIRWVAERAEEAEVALSVCTGAFVLARAGVLDGLEATTWHGAVDGLRLFAIDTVVHEDTRWVDNGRVITSAGVSAGIDSSLYVVARLLGDDVARATAAYMEYDWRPDEVTGHVASGAPGERTLAQRVIGLVLGDGVKVALTEYRAQGAIGKVLTEEAINRVGYSLLQSGQTEKAIRIFEFNVAVHPEAFNTYDSLGEAYMTAGDAARAIENYERSLELNPENDNAAQMLRRLRNGGN